MISVRIYCKSKGGGQVFFVLPFFCSSCACGRRKEYYTSLMTNIKNTLPPLPELKNRVTIYILNLELLLNVLQLLQVS